MLPDDEKQVILTADAFIERKEKEYWHKIYEEPDQAAVMEIEALDKARHRVYGD